MTRTAWCDMWRDRLGLIQLMLLARASSVGALTVLVLVNGLIPASLSVAIGLLVNRSQAAARVGLHSPQGRALLVAVGAVGAVVLLERLVPPVLDTLRAAVGRQIDGALRGRLLEAIERPDHILQLESPETQDSLSLVSGGLFGTAGSAAVAGVGVVGRYLQAISSVAVIAWFSVPIAVLFFTVIVAIRRRWHVAFAQLAGAMIQTAGKMRRASYFSDLLFLPSAAKETRVYGILDWLVGKQRLYWHEAVDQAFDVRGRLRRRANFELVALLGSYLLTTVLAARAASRDEIGLGVLAAVLQCEFWAAQLIVPAPEDYATGGGMAALRALRAIEATSEATSRARHPLPSSAPEETIVFQEVTFAYPWSERPALRDFSLEIRSGESLAIVGENGAGKTTLIKLLTGLYEPTAGQILIDGRNIADYDRRSWSAAFATVFQDFNHYEASAEDNVIFGNPQGPVDVEGRDRAAMKAGALDIIESLPNRWDTLLSRRYEGGIELSGGQWQRVAIARALYAVERGARLLVLDEPTANLDVRAEAQLFNHLMNVTQGITTILISHRFSSVRQADRIVVVADGRVSEDGTHGHLMAINGLYAQMFRAQADAFTVDSSPPPTEARPDTVPGGA